MKVTVLIAVYNSSRYLRECLDSLRGQTMTDFQAICVDDCSADDSAAILQEYAEADNRFTVVRLSENHGQAYARNEALKLAKGEYTCFLDSDDFLSADALERVVTAFETNGEVDCVLFKLKLCDEQGRVKGDYPQEDFQTMGGEEAFLKSLSWQIHGVYAVRTHLFLRFPYDDSAYTYSDDNTTRLHFYHARLVATCEGIYFYRQHAQSVTNAVSLRRFDYLKANASMRRQLLQLGVSRDIIDRYENIRWLNVVDLYMLYYQHRRQFPAADRKEALAMVRQAWQSILVESLEPRNRWKFGYCPCRPFWLLFRIQEEAYFTLRHLRDRILR